jgi:hypothetical protein
MLAISQRKTGSKHHNRKALCFFLTYEEPTIPGGFLSKDLDRLRSGEDKFGYEAHTVSMKKAETPSLRHLEGDIRRGFGYV